MPLAAVRTVREDDDVRIIEGLGIPFGGPFAGRDSYGTFASARTDFAWDLFPDVEPKATRDAGDEPRFIRPLTYNHGFDPEIGLRRMGGWSPVRVDDDGVWVQAQLDKRQKYYARIAELLDAEALGFSSGSAEHSVRIARSGEWLEWPVYELALTPTESNPYAVIATRSAETAETIRVLVEPPAPADVDAPPAVRDSEAAGDAVTANSVLGSLLWLLGDEDVEEQSNRLRTAIDALQAYVAAEVAEVGTPEDAMETALSELSYAYFSAVREGRRNSASDSSRLSSAHDALATVLELGCAPNADDASRSAPEPALIRLSAATERPEKVLESIVADAVRSASEDAIRRLTDLRPGTPT